MPIYLEPLDCEEDSSWLGRQYIWGRNSKYAAVVFYANIVTCVHGQSRKNKDGFAPISLIGTIKLGSFCMDLGFAVLCSNVKIT